MREITKQSNQNGRWGAVLADEYKPWNISLARIRSYTGGHNLFREFDDVEKAKPRRAYMKLMTGMVFDTDARIETISFIGLTDNASPKDRYQNCVSW